MLEEKNKLKDITEKELEELKEQGFKIEIINYMKEEKYKEIRDKISKILVKWSMPTRQVAINEIMELIKEQEKKLIKQFENFLLDEEFVRENQPWVFQMLKNNLNQQ